MNGVTPRKIVSSGTNVHADRQGDQAELDDHHDDNARTTPGFNGSVKPHRFGVASDRALRSADAAGYL
jgi:hypothetical protein